MSPLDLANNNKIEQEVIPRPNKNSTVKKAINKSTKGFYDSLAMDYHLVYQNWDKSMTRQAKVIDQLIKKQGLKESTTLLDCTCGIGTQSIGLSQLGYEVYGTDLSPAAIERAQQEAAVRKLSIVFEAVDVKELAQKIKGQFDVVISFDNSLPHLQEREELLLAAISIRAKMKAKGFFIGSIRDYDRLLEEKPTSTLPVKRQQAGMTTITFQLWDWGEDHSYVVHHFTVKGQDDKFETQVRKAEYRAYSRSEISGIFQEAGFQKIDWLMPEQTGFYQPIFIGIH